MTKSAARKHLPKSKHPAKSKPKKVSKSGSKTLAKSKLKTASNSAPKAPGNKSKTGLTSSAKPVKLPGKLIAPSILSADFANLKQELDAITAAGADWIHVDVMDGQFVDNITIGVPVVASLKKFARLPLDVHLMIENPEKYVDAFVKAGADYLTIHVESTADPGQVLKQIRAAGVKVGITLRPRTPIFAIRPFLDMVDLVLVMTVEPGFGGQTFMYEQVEKITELKKWREEGGYKFLIEVDGGVNDQTLSDCKDADVLVAGSYVFKNEYSAAIKVLKGHR